MTRRVVEKLCAERVFAQEWSQYGRPIQIDQNGRFKPKWIIFVHFGLLRDEIRLGIRSFLDDRQITHLICVRLNTTFAI